jgi:S1-C subfamily serine protease
MVRTVMDQLVRYGEVKRGILGVNIVTLTPDLADNLGVKDAQGALVSQVVEGSAADKAGVKAGDVITAVNGSAVKSAGELRNRIGLLRVGESVELGVMRDGKPRRIVATVQTRAASRAPSSPTRRAAASRSAASSPAARPARRRCGRTT